MIALILNTLSPVFLVVLLGATLRGTGFVTERFATDLNRFVFWVSLPVFLFTSILESEFVEGSLAASGTMACATLAIAAISWFGAPLFGISARSRGSFCQSVFRSNNAYVGLPVILFAYAGEPDSTIASIRALAALALAPCLILYNVLAVIVLMPNAEGAFDHNAEGESQTHIRIPVRKLLRGIAHNPLIVACVAGSVALFVRQRIGVDLPEFAHRTLHQIGSLAGPGALFALGGSLTPARMRAAMRGAHVVALLKLVICPLLGALFALAFRLGPDARFVALAYLTCPTAVASFVMAQAMKGDDVLAGGAVALTTLYSVLALAILLALAR